MGTVQGGGEISGSSKMLEDNHSAKKQLAFEGQGSKEFETEQWSGFADTF